MVSPAESRAELLHLLHTNSRKCLATLACRIASAHCWGCLHVASSLTHSQAANEEKTVLKPEGPLSPPGGSALLPAAEPMHLLQSFPNTSYCLTSDFSPIHISGTCLGEYLEKPCQKPHVYLDTRHLLPPPLPGLLLHCMRKLDCATHFAPDKPRLAVTHFLVISSRLAIACLINCSSAFRGVGVKLTGRELLALLP